MAQARTTPVDGTFTASGQSPSFQTAGGFNMSISGFGTATVVLQRSFDAGVTWKNVASYTAAAEKRVDEPEVGVFYRFDCTHSSGTIAYRLSS